MAEDDERAPVFKRVDHISGGVGVNLGFIGVDVRYRVGHDRCEVRIQFWFRLKLRFKTIKITQTLDWVGCEEGLATALALADQFDLTEIELCDPEGRVSEEVIAHEVHEFLKLKREEP